MMQGVSGHLNQGEGKLLETRGSINLVMIRAEVCVSRAGYAPSIGMSPASHSLWDVGP